MDKTQDISFQILAAVSVFVLAIVGGLIPVRLGRTDPSHSLGLSLGNFFSAGVFLATGLLHMLPDAHEAFEDLGITTYPFAELLCGVGFLLVLFLERIMYDGHEDLIVASAEHKEAGSDDVEKPTESMDDEEAAEAAVHAVKKQGKGNGAVLSHANYGATRVANEEQEQEREQEQHVSGGGGGRPRALSAGSSSINRMGLDGHLEHELSSSSQEGRPLLFGSGSASHKSGRSMRERLHTHGHAHAHGRHAGTTAVSYDQRPSVAVCVRSNTFASGVRTGLKLASELNAVSQGGDLTQAGDSFTVDAMHHDHDTQGKNALVPFLLLAVLTVHSFIAGLALGVLKTSVQEQTFFAIYIAIVSHKFLAAFALGVALVRAQVRRSLIIRLILLFGLVTPTGIITGLLISIAVTQTTVVLIQAIALGLGSGTFLYVAGVGIVVEEFEESTERKGLKFLLILVGFSAMASVALVV